MVATRASREPTPRMREFEWGPGRQSGKLTAGMQLLLLSTDWTRSPWLGWPRGVLHDKVVG